MSYLAKYREYLSHYNKYLKINKKEGFYTIHDTILKITMAKVENKIAFFTIISALFGKVERITNNEVEKGKLVTLFVPFSALITI
jgi:hypothetical protein